MSTPPLYTEVKDCRSCGSGPLLDVLDFGRHAIADFNRRTPDWRYAPLELVMCRDCTLLQLRHTVSRSALFDEYWYRSGLSETMCDALREVAETATAAVPLTPEDVVVDIGSNDGTLLGHFKQQMTVGFEPSNVSEVHRADFLFRSPFVAKQYLGHFPVRAKLVFSIAVFYSVEDPVTFVKGVARILDKDGLWVCQMNDVLGLVQNSAYDIIGFEHLCIWSLHSLRPLLARYKLEVVHVDRLALNGGTARLFIRHQGFQKPDETVEDQVLEERGLRGDMTWRDRMGALVSGLSEVVEALRTDGKVVHLMGASNRGSTIVQATHLDGLVEVAADRDPAKHGMLMPGTAIRIVSEEESRALRPDVYLTLPYSYVEQFKRREADFLARGGQFLVPIPTIHLEGA